MADEVGDPTDKPAGTAGTTADVTELADEIDASDEVDGGPGQELHNALPPRVEAWRRRSVTGAMLTGIARGLGQVFDPERERPAIVAEMQGEPPPPPGPVEAKIDPEDPEASRLIVRSWMIEPDAGQPEDD